MVRKHSIIGFPLTQSGYIPICEEHVQQMKLRFGWFLKCEGVNALELEKAQGKSGQLAYRLMYVDMVILDSC